MISRLFIAPLAVAAFAVQVAGAYAQGAFPAPLPGQSSAAPASSSPFPPVNGAPAAASPFPPVGGAPATPSAFPSGGAAPLSGGGFAPPQQQAGPSGNDDACMKGFLPLRQEAEKRGAAIKAAS